MSKKTELPRAFSIFGTTHFPPVDNQGAIGSCASQAITRNQFSNAVSRLLHSREEGCSFCPRDRMNERFSPKFSYNMSGAGTAWVYEFLTDHGALFQDEVNFKKNEQTNGSLKTDDKGNLYTESTSFSVEPGQMERALFYRVTGFRQNWFTKPPYNEKLTTSEAGRKLLTEIKKALLRGDAVVTGGYPGRWVFTKIEGPGTLGKEGEEAVVASGATGGGGHQVTIVGYDDDLTAVFAGVRLKGAFLVANSYGTGWKNGGLCWMMYDAVNTVSEYEELNDPKLFSGPMYLTHDDQPRMFPEALTAKSTSFEFTEDGSYTLGGKTYPAYTVKDARDGSFLTYNEGKEERGLFFSKDAGRRFALIPYPDQAALGTSDEKYRKEEYGDSYWIYCVDKDTNEEGFRVVDAGVSFSASGRSVGIASHNAGRYPEAKSFLLDKTPCAHFVSRLAIAAGRNASSTRLWAVDQFCFLDWKKDVTTGMPPLYAKVSVRATDRDCFTLVLTRKEKGGKRAKKYMPAIFRYASCHPSYCDKKKGEYLNFDGVKNGGEAEGEFALSYLPLLKLPRGKRPEDYEWCVELCKGRKGRAKLTRGVLCGQDGKVRCSAAPSDKKLIFYY